ncbi:hypothetical protein [Clostridium tertium]|uniref:hypothetical protein n=1 Tax=Clostridium tertium TaxID=1559 RepID=UPI0035613A2C
MKKKEEKIFLRNQIIKFIVFFTLIIIFVSGIKVAEDKGRELREKIKRNILIEVKKGEVINIFKEAKNEKIKYETLIKIDDEIITSKEKEIYHKALYKVGKEVNVEIKNNKNIGRKYILDIR